MDVKVDEQRLGSGFLYKTVYDLLGEKISSGDLPQGAVLKEGSIATQLDVSRVPVRRALAMLRDDGVVRAGEGQGFVVGSAPPLKLTARALHDILVSSHKEMDRTALWERIIDAVQEQIEGCMAFGHYRVLEAELGEFHNVSRTVVREVLWQLRDRGLVGKDRKSHWILSQLSARDIHDAFEMRRVCEPHALLAVALLLDPKWLAQVLERIQETLHAYPHITPMHVDRIEDDMFHAMYQNLRNERMLSTMRRNQTCLLVSRLFRKHFPMRDEKTSMQEFVQILHHVLVGTPDVAAVLLDHHLKRSEAVTKARLRVLAAINLPETPPYLRSIHYDEAERD
jgi:DNA-binding GntR family transcriptional regulator